MRICPVCGKLNPEASRNCDVCGAPLNKVTAVSDPLSAVESAPNNLSGPICPVCRRGNRSASMFCAYCGYRLKPAGGDGASLYALPKSGAASAPVPPTAPMIPADVSGNIPSGVLLKRRYRIMRKIAQGGMGAVYECSDAVQQNGTRFAIKEMSPAALPPSERRQAISDFRREAQILATLNHPNLPHVVETFEEMGKYFLVMEFIAGRTLLNVVDTTVGFIPEERIMVWARQMFDVLHYLHSQDPPIIYRDVKPANVMLVESTERIKLIDFGIARFHKAGKVQDTEAFGTAGYAPPEQYGKGQTDQRSDVYALGATLHHLVTKQDPSLNPFNWVPVRRLNPHISASLENAIMVATSLDPARRFQTIEEFAQSLGVLLPGVVVQPKPVEVTSPPLAPVAKAAAASVAASAASAASAPAAAAAPPRPRSNQSKKKSQTATPAPEPALTPKPSTAKPNGKTPSPSPAPAMPVAAGSTAAAKPAEISVPTGTGPVAKPFAAPAPVVAAAASAASAIPLVAQPKKKESLPTARPNQVPVAMPAGSVSGKLVVSEPVIDLGEARWNTRPARKVSLSSPTGMMRGMVLATQPWIAYNPQHFQGSAITLDVKVKKSQLRFNHLQLQVPNLFAIIWTRTRKVLPLIGFWFWLVVLVGSSFGRTLLLAGAGLVGSLLLFEVLMWLWAQHVRLFVPTERVNTGRIVVKSSGGDQQIDVKVLARPSWLQRATGWSLALLLFVAEIALVTWAVLAFMGVTIPLPIRW